MIFHNKNIIYVSQFFKFCHFQNIYNENIISYNYLNYIIIKNKLILVEL